LAQNDGEPIKPKKKKGRYDYDYEEMAEAAFSHSADARDIVIVTLDDAIHKLIKQLKKSGIYDNTVILVTTDNGGANWKSNSPLRGTKQTLYEGGIRGVSFLLSPLLNKPGRHFNGLVHLADWYPTFVKLAGLEMERGLDGVDQWEAINLREKSPRKRIIHNIDINKHTGAYQGCIQNGNYKLILGQDELLKRSQPHMRYRKQLYNIKIDPNETRNLAKLKPKVVKNLENMIIDAQNRYMVKADFPKGVKRGWPSNFNGTISPGWC